MIKILREIDGFQGGYHTPCTIWVADMTDGTSWYVEEYGSVAFQTMERLEDGVDIEEINDIDLFTVSGGMKDIDVFERLVEE